MNRTQALELLTESKPFLASHYGVTELALFGSTVRIRRKRRVTWMFWLISMVRRLRSVISGCSFTWKICRLPGGFGDREGIAPGVASVY